MIEENVKFHLGNNRKYDVHRLSKLIYGPFGGPWTSGEVVVLYDLPIILMRKLRPFKDLPTICIAR